MFAASPGFSFSGGWQPQKHTFLGLFLLPEPAKPINDAQMRWSLYTQYPARLALCPVGWQMMRIWWGFLFSTAVPFLWFIPLSLPDCGQPLKRQPPFPKRDNLRSENAVKAHGFFETFFQEPKESLRTASAYGCGAYALAKVHSLSFS